MNVVQSQSFIVGAMAGTAIITTAETLAEGKPPAARSLIGFAGACVGLGIIALWAPDLAASLSGLVLVATIFVNSQALTSAIIKITK